MLYNNISEIKLSSFIEAVTGNVKAVIKSGSHSLHTDKECSERTGELMMQYVDSCGGHGSGAKLDRKKRYLLLMVRKNMLQACKALCAGGFYTDVIEPLGVLGYKYNEEEHEKISKRIDQLLKKCQYDIDIFGDVEEETKEMKASDFTKERVMIMTHYKIYIDPSVYTAEEYAFLVRQYNNEYEDMIKKHARMNK